MMKASDDNLTRLFSTAEGTSAKLRNRESIETAQNADDM
jgi:hypothetical protein